MEPRQRLQVCQRARPDLCVTRVAPRTRLPAPVMRPLQVRSQRPAVPEAVMGGAQ
jgi:hypothetical protein